MPAASPLIAADSWGVLEVEDATYKDAKLWPGGVRGWDWTETGTTHQGMNPADVDELIAAGAEVVILSTGRSDRLAIPAATVRRLRQRRVEVEILATDEAIRRYNDLAEQGLAVGALIHSTC